MDLDALKAELDANTHPVTGAYDVDNTVAAAQLNALNITRVRASMTGSEVLALTNQSEFDALTDVNKSSWLALCGIDSLDPSDSGVGRNMVVSIFGGGSATAIALNSARNETVSRAVDIGLGVVTSDNVKQARLR